MRVFKSGCLWIVGLMAAGVLAYAGDLYSIDFLAADDCADAGGSFHFDRGVCSFTENYTGEVPPLWPF